MLEAADEPGGAVKSGELTEPGFTSDLFSAFYPLAAVSPAIQALELERYGLRWRRSPLAVAHPQPDGACAGALARRRRDGGLARALRPRRRRAPGTRSTPTGSAPAVRSSTRCCARSPRCAAARGWRRRSARAGCCASARFALHAGAPPGRGALPRRGRRLAAGRQRAARRPHARVGRRRAVRLGALRPRAGARLPGPGGRRRAARRRARRRGCARTAGRLECGVRVARVLVRGGRAVGVRTADGDEISAGRGVLATHGRAGAVPRSRRRAAPAARLRRATCAASSTTTRR